MESSYIMKGEKSIIDNPKINGTGRNKKNISKQAQFT